MKRLLAQIGITFFSVLATAFYLPDRITFILMIACTVTTIVFFFIRKIRKKIFPPVMAIAAVLACLLNLSYTALFVTPVVNTYVGEHTIEATLKDEVRQNYNAYYYPLRVESVDGEKAGFDLMLISNDEIRIDPYDTLSFLGTIEKEDESYQICKGYYLKSRAYTLDCQVKPNEHKPIYYTAIQVRRYFRKALDRLLPSDDAALCRAILIGDKYALSGEIRDQFKFSGASYFIVVSGMHFAFFTLVLTFLLKKLIKNRYVYIPIVMVFTLLYMAVTGFSFSVVQSGIMMLMLLVSQLIRRRSYPMNSLGFAGLILPIIFTPYCAGDLGLILSFYATFAILQWSAPIYEKIRIKREDEKKEKKWHKAVNYLLQLLSATLAANILVFPISLVAFHAFSSVTLLSAILLYFEIEGILVLSLIVCLLWLIPPIRFLSVAVSWVLYFVCELVMFIVDTLSGLPFSYIRIGDMFIFLWILMTAVLMALVYFSRRGYKYAPLAILCSLAILFGGLATTQLLKDDKPVLSVDQADGGMIVTLEENGQIYLLTTDASYREQYRTLREIAEEHTSAMLAVVDTDKERQLLENVSQREFAISHILQYDKGKEVIPSENVTSFKEEYTVCISDGTDVTLFPAGTSSARFIRTKSMTALILPNGCDVSQLPDEVCFADVIVMGSKTAFAEKLRCDKLVLTAPKPLCEIQAKALCGNCRGIYYISENELSIKMENSYAERN